MSLVRKITGSLSLRRVLFLLFLAIIIVVLLVNFQSAKKGESLSTEEVVEEVTDEKVDVMTDVDPKEIEEYKNVYTNPHVVFLRKALDSYLDGSWQENGVDEAAVKGIVMEGITSGLDSFDKDYYKSKFWVMTIDNSINGGKDIQIVFKDKPDKMFYAWVYKLNMPEEEYELRGFSSRDDVSKETLDASLEFYAPLLEIEELSI